MIERKPLEFGVNLNNREPLIAPDYGVPELLDLSETVEALGFDSVWVGDSLFSKPRYEALALLSAISQRTKRVRLGTACLVTSSRNPLYLAMEWATLDVISAGRTIFGCCAGNPEAGVRREFEALGLDFDRRFSIFEEGLAVLRALWTTPYGVTLIVKLCAVALVLALGAWNWRRQRPRMGSEAAAWSLRRSARMELAAAALVLAITAILVSLPSPRPPRPQVRTEAPRPPSD